MFVFFYLMKVTLMMLSTGPSQPRLTSVLRVTQAIIHSPDSRSGPIHWYGCGHITHYTGQGTGTVT